MGSNTLIGFIVAAVIGVGGALGIEALASGMQSAEPAGTESAGIPARLVLVESVVGALEARGVDGVWRPVAVSNTLSRPVSLRTRGGDALGVVKFGSVRAALGHGAELWVGMPSPAAQLHVEAGQVVFDKDGPELTVHVPLHAMVLRGTSFGVFVEPDRATFSVLRGSAQVIVSGGEPTKFARLREIVLKDGRLSPSVMPTKLDLSVTAVARRGRRYTLNGRTTTQAILLKKTSEGYERVAIALGGTFATQIADKTPAPGELVAYDSAGRRAEVDAPSGTTDTEVQAILEGRGRQGKGDDTEAVKALDTPPPPPPVEAPVVEAPPRRKAAAPPPADAPPPVSRPPPVKKAPPKKVKPVKKAPPKPKKELAAPPDEDEEAL